MTNKQHAQQVRTAMDAINEVRAWLEKPLAARGLKRFRFEAADHLERAAVQLMQLETNLRTS